MSAIPGSLDTEQQPPMTVPLRHFILGLAFLLAGTTVGLGLVVDAIPGLGTVAHLHLLLAGWICLTIMGAMTQFVPVWSGISLHSRRLANLQLLFVTVGLAGFIAALLLSSFVWVAVFGAVMLVGFWLFVYNIFRTLAEVESYDVTERHFLLALLFFLAFSAFGVLLAISLSSPVLSSLPIAHAELLGAHVTLAVFGAVLTTVYGALYQLATMFTQTELHGIDTHLQSFEEIGHPAGVVFLAVGRLFDTVFLAQVGGGLILLAALSIAFVLGRKLYEMQVEWTPMHRRYAVIVPALFAWAVLSLPAWMTDPTAYEHLFGAAGSVYLLVLGVIGFVVLGTLYHVIPFIIWVHQYSDRLGLEEVPMIDDLYDHRLAAADFILILTGTVLLVSSDLLLDTALVTGLGATLVTLGAFVFAVNMLLVVHHHGPHSVMRVVVGRPGLQRDRSDSEQTTAED